MISLKNKSKLNENLQKTFCQIILTITPDDIKLKEDLVYKNFWIM